VAYFLIFASILLRILPHPANFAPIAAMALFGGVYLNKKYAYGVPLLALFISDFLIGFYNPWVMLAVYSCFIFIGFLGTKIRDHKNFPIVIGSSLLGSIVFFLTTNFAVWAIPNSMYPHTLTGLVQSYVMGLPFFRNTLVGDLFYVGIMFGLMELSIIINSKFVQKEVRVHIERFRR